MIKYAQNRTRARRDFFVMPCSNPDALQALDFFFWVAVSKDHTVVIDTGFDEKESVARGYPILRDAVKGLRLLGINACDVQHVVLTHLHWDHAGGVSLFPSARFYVQAKELEFIVNGSMQNPKIRGGYSSRNICAIVDGLHQGRVVILDGDEKCLPGIHGYYIGGHTNGLQAVGVSTSRGEVILASDAAFFYENLLKKKGFPQTRDLAQSMRGFGTLLQLAKTPQLIVPAHDPLVLKNYPPASPELSGIIHRLDGFPIGLADCSDI